MFDSVGPIAMLNLLRYDGEEGRTAYGRYAQVAAMSISHVGGSLMYLGQVIESDAWDSVALVRYPSAQAYLAMQLDQRYVDAIPHRTAGLRARLLCPFALPHVVDRDVAELTRGGDSEIMEVQLVRWNDPPARLGGGANSNSAKSSPALRLQSVGNGLVSDGRWDELLLRHSPSNERNLTDSESLRRSDPDIAELAVVFSRSD